MPLKDCEGYLKTRRIGHRPLSETTLISAKIPYQLLEMTSAFTALQKHSHVLDACLLPHVSNTRGAAQRLRRGSAL